MIKKFLALFIAVLMVMSLLYPIAVSKVAKANSSTVLISEFQVGGTSGGSDEFIEFYNASDNDVDVSGWKVMYLSASGTTEYTRYTFPQNTIIPAHKHYLITNSNGYSGSVPGDGTYSQGLAKSGGGIGLRDNNGTLIDSVGYGSATNAFVEGNAAPKPSYGESDERKPGGSAGNGTDTDNNADDFFVQNAPNPQNLDSPPTPPLNNNDADLTIKVTGPAKATIGDPNSFEYTIEYKNIGASDAEGVLITDTFPAGVTYKSDDSGITPTVSGNKYVWNVGTVSAGADVTFHINATVDGSVAPGTVLTNNVSISTTSTESNTDNNISSCDVTATDIWPIRDARGITDSTKTVKVQGNVVLTPGTLDSSNREMYIQDETGGIDVYYGSGLPNLQLGDLVTVSGTISSYHNKIEIKPTSVSDVVFNDYGGFVVPQTVTSSDISDHLGTLVYISGTVSDKGSSSFKVNGVKVYIDGDTGIDISGVNDGDTVTVVGIAEQYYSDYEILPRYQYDIAKTAVTPIGVARGLSSNTSVTIQGVVTSGEVFSGGKAFFVQDGTGGIEVYGVSGLNISEGDLIEVTGETSAYNGLKQIKISDSSAVTQQGFTGILITPKLDDTGKIDGCRESLLVKVEGVVSGAHSSYFYINDGSGSIKVYDSSSEVSFSDVSDGDNLIIVGIVGEYKGTMEIFPRTQDDIIFNRPCVVSTVPDNNATNVNVNTTISATFDRDMNSSTITTSTFTLKDSSGNAISGAVNYDSSSKTAIFTPSDPLSENETYTATVSGTVEDTEGNAMGSDYSWSFSTGTPQVITIAEARTRSEGDVVYVEGNVTVKPGTFNKGFAIQDATGGIYVYNTGSIENFNLGDDVKVKGTLKSFNGLLEISADNADIEFVSSGTVPAPKIEQTGSVGESTEGLLIEISGTVESVSGSSFIVNDGTGAATVYIDSDTGISIAGMEVGDSATIIGFSSQYDTAAPYDSGYQVMPRMQSDISFEEVPVYQGPCPVTLRQVAPSNEQVVKILEVMYNSLENGSDEKGEAVRIINISNSSVNISNWQITDNEASVLFPEDTVLKPGEKIWIARDAKEFEKEFGEKPDFEYGADSDPSVPQMDNAAQYPIFDNVADECEIVDASNREVDAIVWGSGCACITGWSGEPVEPYVFASYVSTNGDIICRKLDESTGLPVPDTDTLSDWSTDPDDPINGCKVMYPGWNTIDDFFFPPKDTAKVHTTFMAAPDNTFKGITDFIDSARHSIKIEVYLLTNYEIADHIVSALKKGVSVTAVFDGEVYGASGGTYDSERYIAKEIVDNGGKVYFLRGDGNYHDRYNNIHAKFIIVDDSKVFISSENFSRGPMPSDDKSNGTAGNRGSAVITDDPVIVHSLVKVFNHDCNPGYYDVSPYDPSRDAPPADFTYNPPSDKTGYTPVQSNPLSVYENESLELIDSPDTALRNTDSLIGLINKAGKGDVIMEEAQYEYVYWGPSDHRYINPRLQALVNAAKRGANVYILLNGAYGVDANTATKNYVEAQSSNIHCLLGTPTGSGDYGAYPIHNKQFIMWINGKGYVNIGSINGSENSSRVNREMALQIQSDAGFEYYKKIFDHDWHVSGGGNVNVNHKPTVSVSPAEIKVPDGAFATTKIHASDPDGDHPVISVTVDPKPFGTYTILNNNVLKFLPSKSDADKVFVFTITATDPQGLSAFAQFRVTVFKHRDATPPTLVIPDINPNISEISNNPALSFTINANDDSGKIARVIIKDNNTVMKDVFDNISKVEIALFEGINDISVTVYDTSGNYTVKTFRVVSDTKPPIIKLDCADKVVSTDNLLVKGKVFDITTGVSSVTVNGKSAVLKPDGMLKTKLHLNRGKNIITVKATDKAGNTAVKTFSVTYSPSYAAGNKIVILQINNPYIMVNGDKKKIDVQGNKPVVRNNRTLLPIRSLIESLGGKIYWNPKTREVTVELNGNTILLTIGKNTALVNGIKTKIDPNNSKVVPVIINGRTYLPLRFIAERLNCTVDWDPVTKSITIYYYG